MEKIIFPKCPDKYTYISHKMIIPTIYSLCRVLGFGFKITKLISSDLQVELF